MNYLSLETLIGQIQQPERDRVEAILLVHRPAFELAAGSSSKHQAWWGGYLDHVAEVMNLAVVLYDTLSSTGRLVPFTLSDALLVLFLHDLEKGFLYNGEDRAPISKAERKAMREDIMRQFDIELTESQANALCYVEGEGDDYDPERRMMNELAAFCHSCDVLSARLWHDYPLAFNDPWHGAQQHQYKGCTRCAKCGWIGKPQDLAIHTERTGRGHWYEYRIVKCPRCSYELSRVESDAYYNYPG